MCAKDIQYYSAGPRVSDFIVCVLSVLVPLESKWNDWPTFISLAFSRFLSLVTLAGHMLSCCTSRGDMPETLKLTLSHLESTIVYTKVTHTPCASQKDSLHSESSWRHLQTKGPKKKRQGQTHVFSCFLDETLSENLASKEVRKPPVLHANHTSRVPTVNP